MNLQCSEANSEVLWKGVRQVKHWPLSFRDSNKFRHAQSHPLKDTGWTRKRNHLYQGCLTAAQQTQGSHSPPVQPGLCHCCLLAIFITLPATSALKAQGQRSDWGLKRSVYYSWDNEKGAISLAGTKTQGKNVRNVLALRLGWVILTAPLISAVAFNPFL